MLATACGPETARRIFEVLVVMRGLVVPANRIPMWGRATKLIRLADSIVQGVLDKRSGPRLPRLAEEYLELRDGLVDPVRNRMYVESMKRSRAQRKARGQGGDDELELSGFDG